MKTLWIIDNYASEPQYGGISRQYDFAIALEKYNIQTIIISSSYSHFTHKYFCENKIHISKIGKYSAFVYLRITPDYQNSLFKRFYNMNNFKKKVLIFSKTIERNLGKPDAVVGSSVHPLSWVAAWRLADKYKVNFVAEVRDLWPEYFVKNKIYSPHHPVVIFFGLLESMAYHKAKIIISSLPHADKYICDKLKISHDKFLWIGQPMDCVRFDANAKRYTELPEYIKKFMDQSFICSFTGYYAEYEGLLTMLKAAKIIETKKLPIKFLFLGSGREKEKMNQFVQKHNLKNVLIGERISKELVPAVLCHSQIHLCEQNTVNNNFYEYGISKNKLSEYLYANGCTIFGFSFKDNDVEKSEGGIVIPPNQPQKMAEAIEQIYNMDEQEQMIISKNGTQYIKKSFGVDILARKYAKTIFGEGVC